MGGAEFEEIGEFPVMLLKQLQRPQSLFTISSQLKLIRRLNVLRGAWCLAQRLRTGLPPAHARFLLLLG